MNINKGKYEAVSNEILDISNDIFNDDFSRFALSKMQIEIQEDENSRCNIFMQQEFANWHRDCADDELEVLQHQFDQFVGLMDNAKPFDSVLFDSSRILDLESSEVVRKLTVEPDISEATIFDFDCGTGTKTLSIMRYLYEWNGVSALTDKDFVLVAKDAISLRMATIQILFHLNKYNLKIAKISGYVSENLDDFSLNGLDYQTLICGHSYIHMATDGLNDDHDCVIAETEHLLVLAP